MGSRRRASSSFGVPGILDVDGNIDLSGARGQEPSEDTPSSRPSGDAWVFDRDRRSLPPPPTAQPTRPDRVADAEMTVEDIHLEIEERFALGDYAGALSTAELQLGRDPEDAHALNYAQTSRERLEQRYATRIGSLESIFNVVVPPAKIKWLGLDPQAAFLLSLVDGQTTVVEVLELCRMERLEALRVFTELLDAKAIQRVA